MTVRLADLVPVMVLFAAMAVGSVLVTAAAWGLVTGVVAPGLRRTGWFLSAGPTAARRLVTTLVMVVTAGAVLATRPWWLWVSVTPFSYANPVFTAGNPGLVDSFAVTLAVASALAGAWLSQRRPAVRRAHPPGLRPGRRSFAGAAASAGTVIIAGAALGSLVSAAAAIPADVTRPAFWWQAAGSPAASRGPLLAVALSSYDTGAATVYRAAGYGQRVRPVAEIQPPAGGEFSDITALGNDQTFILTTIVPSDAPVFRSYEVRLAPDGHPGPLTPVRLPDARDLTFSADGSKVAGVVPGRRGTEIMVLTLASGTIRAWSAPGQAADLSWAGDRDIAFMWSPPVSGGPSPAAGLRLLDTTAPGRDLLRSRPLIPAAARFAGMRRLSSTDPVLVSSDGTALFAVLTAPRGAPGGPRTGIVEFSARTGQPLRVLSEDHQADADIYCGVVWADPAAQHVLSSCGSTVSSLDGSAITSWHSRTWDALAPFAS